MDETRLVLIGHNVGCYDLKIAVLDFGQMQPFCHYYQQKSSSVLSGYSNLEVFNNYPLANSLITTNIPFPRFVLNGLKLIGSKKFYNFCFLPFSLSTCAFLYSVIIKKLKW